MNKKEKAKFIRDTLNQTRDALLTKLDNVPESWDGHELRAWIVQDVARNIGSRVIPQQLELKDLRHPRVKAFRTELLMRNL